MNIFLIGLVTEISASCYNSEYTQNMFEYSIKNTKYHTIVHIQKSSSLNKILVIGKQGSYPSIKYDNTTNK